MLILISYDRAEGSVVLQFDWSTFKSTAMVSEEDKLVIQCDCSCECSHVWGIILLCLRAIYRFQAYYLVVLFVIATET